MFKIDEANMTRESVRYSSIYKVLILLQTREERVARQVFDRVALSQLFSVCIVVSLLIFVGCDDGRVSSEEMRAGIDGQGVSQGGEAEMGGAVSGEDKGGGSAGEEGLGGAGGVEMSMGGIIEGGASGGGEGAGEMILEAGTLPPDPWLEEEAELAAMGQITLTRIPQRAGDPEAGWDYLRYGGYIGAGIPLDAFLALIPDISDGNRLMRDGESAEVARSFNIFEAMNGVKVIAATTCFGCHSSYLNGELVLGLGNTFADYTSSRTEALIPVLNGYINGQYGVDSPEADAYLEFGRGSARVAPFARSPFRGINPAFRVEDAAASMRDPVTLEWLDAPLFEVSETAFSSDTPPWWNIKKKAALYYNGMGRGHFTKMMMQTGVVAVSTRAQSREIHSHFDDVLAWIETLEPPPYPAEINAEAVPRGELVFNQNCSRCHGTYASDPAQETYPNLLIALDVVETDPHYAQYSHDHPELSRWLNRSWFAETDAEGGDSLLAYPLLGYVAPPLDGIWATAPYLHNGSVPTLRALLDSSTRPERWQRDFSSTAYDFDTVGWPYSVPAEGELEGEITVYDTRVTGYRNTGHTFGDPLSEDQRADLIEYLKTL